MRAHTHTRGTPNFDNASGHRCCYTTKKNQQIFVFLFWLFFSMIPTGLTSFFHSGSESMYTTSLGRGGSKWLVEFFQKFENHEFYIRIASFSDFLEDWGLLTLRITLITTRVCCMFLLLITAQLCELPTFIATSDRRGKWVCGYFDQAHCMHYYYYYYYYCGCISTDFE
jgi:hypothetical protein